MSRLRDEIRDFLSANEAARLEAAQLAALQLACGMDFGALLCADESTRAGALKTIQRSLRRERLKGLAGHWSYDLNRHIALKQAFERLRHSGAGAAAPVPQTKNGARRRRLAVT